MGRKLRTLTLGLATILIAPLGAVGLTTTAAHVASADQTVNYYATTSNGSDPDVEHCEVTYYGMPTEGYCMYTSQDLGASGNYPMTNTEGYFSTDGVNWTAEGTVFSESQYVSKGWTPSGAKHLWAPSMALGNDGNYYLYVPDISNVSQQHTSSYIGVSRSTSGPFGPFTPLAKVNIPTSLNSGYASDPDVLWDESGTRYLVYANGDTSSPTCGGISIATLDSSMTSIDGSPQQLSISGIGSLGNCGNTGHPYMEGASLYWTASWGAGLPGPYVLEFAAKPTSTPSGCNSNAEPNTANEVIAYATANSPTGPYTYRGILMCGSGTEWTNQASLMPMTTQDGLHTALAMVYHDGPSGNHNRKLHAQCLTFGDGAFASTERPVNVSQGWMPDFGDCMAGYDAVTWGLRYGGKMVSSVLNTSGDSNGQLVLNGSIAQGQWEGFSVSDGATIHEPTDYVWSSGTSTVNSLNLEAFSNGCYVNPYFSDEPTANFCSSPGTGQNASMNVTSDGQGNLTATLYFLGWPVNVAANGWLQFAQNLNGPSTFQVMRYYF